MIKFIRTNSGNRDFIELVKQLDADLAVRDGEEHAFYSQFNTLINIKHVIVAYSGNNPVGCGAIKEYNAGSVEVKRMYVLPANRKEGIASRILSELEIWATELSYNKCILETGKKQPEAIQLYKKNGYTIIPNYGQYAGVENSVCFEKLLSAAL
jgi:GNAT superfamily N-acetyltransferase